MITANLEKFTVEEAVVLGLIDAIKRGETKIEGSYTLGEDGVIEFKQRNFLFTDKFGTLHVGKFVDEEALIDFWGEVGKINGEKFVNFLAWGKDEE